MEKINITLDERLVTVTKGSTIMEAAEQANVYIPHLCHHPDLPDVGECGLCIVEIEGRSEITPACITEAEEGMVIRTRTEKLETIRRLNLELMLSNHIEDCTTCPKYGNCELQSVYQYLGVSVGRLRQTLNRTPVNTNNPLIVRDLNRCISCTRCERICREVRGVDALRLERTPSGRLQVNVKNQGLLADADCRFCGACVEVCPTGALQDVEGLFRADLKRELANIPCQAECPAHIDVPLYIRAIKEGRYTDALAYVRQKAPFPLSLGYICMAFCEDGCKRNELNGSLSIRELKKFAAEQDDGSWRSKVELKPDTGKLVAVVGAGPAGLTAAYDLCKSGHTVDVFEKESNPGGMLWYGIPEFRLPPEVIQKEIDEITRVGVTIHTDTEIKKVSDLKDYDAVLYAIGTGKGVRIPLPGADSKNVYVNTEFLRRAAIHDPLPVGNNVLVLGGGNVAFDCARVAKNLGAEKVSIACLECRDAMTASETEIREGLEVGIQLNNALTFCSIETTDGIASGVHCQGVANFSFGEGGKLELEIAPDSDKFIEADTIIFATGQRPQITEEAGLPLGRGNYILTVDGTRVNNEFVYACGDAVYGTKSVIEAIVAGHEAAKAIDIDLGGTGAFEDKLVEEGLPSPYIGTIPNFAQLPRNFVCANAETSQAESLRCLQCDLRNQIQKTRLWTSY